MIALDIFLDKPAFAEVPPNKFIETTEPIRIAGLEHGTANGNPSVAIGLMLPYKGGCIMGQTTLKLFLTAADALKARYGDPRKEPWDVYLGHALGLIRRSISDQELSLIHRAYRRDLSLTDVAALLGEPV